MSDNLCPAREELGWCACYAYAGRYSERCPFADPQPTPQNPGDAAPESEE